MDALRTCGAKSEVMSRSQRKDRPMSAPSVSSTKVRKAGSGNGTS